MLDYFLKIHGNCSNNDIKISYSTSVVVTDLRAKVNAVGSGIGNRKRKLNVNTRIGYMWLHQVETY